jgi:metacaspase-1
MKKTSWDRQVQKVVPATIYMISSSSDNQQSEEATNTSKFELPNPAGKAGGACTSAFLQQQYENGLEQTWIESLQSMKDVLSTMGFNQTPMLSSSRMFDINSPMLIVPPGSGRRRALLIGINYVGQKGELTACHNDCLNVKRYLEDAHGFNESEMIILIDDDEGRYRKPTKDNIENAMCLLCKYSQPNDVVFVSFSGHGGNIADTGGDEDDGFDERYVNFS